MLLRPSPLEPNAGSAVVRRVLGGEGDDEVAAACHRAAAGNPWLLMEAARELRARPAPDAVAVASLAPPGRGPGGAAGSAGSAPARRPSPVRSR